MYVPMTPGRIIGLLFAIAPLVVVWHLIPKPAEEVSKEQVEAIIVSVNESTLRLKGGDRAVVRSAQVELPDGGKARVMLGNSPWRKGDTIELTLRSFADGSRQVTPLQ